MNIRLVNETTVGSSVNVVNVTDVFTSDFEIYKIVIPQMNTEGVSATDVGMRFITSSGIVIYASDYDYGNRGLLAYSTYQDERSASADSILKFGQADQEPEGTSIVSYVFNPFLKNAFTYVIHENSYRFGSGSGGGKGFGVHHQQVSVGGFQLYAVSSSRPFTTSKIRTYGIRVDT
tara:strand:+ start:572 stop:1099 length:528 start_codon:yes stop_codon:yes gene_type:complete